jgi:uncharacterized protein (DUF488 family)
MTIYTIGSTKHSAQDFFETLKLSGVKRIIDIRINKTSQLTGFAKGADLPYLLREIADIDYLSMENLAPTKDLLRKYRSKEIAWEKFEEEYLKQILDSNSLSTLTKADFDKACLLCSEHTSEKCHRRLLANELEKLWKVEIVHL